MPGLWSTAAGSPPRGPRTTERRRTSSKAWPISTRAAMPTASSKRIASMPLPRSPESASTSRRRTSFASAPPASIGLRAGCPRPGSGFRSTTYALESLGRTLDAADAARAADALAPSEAYRVQARLRRASIARNAGDTAVAVYDHTRSALELYQTIQPHRLEGDERLVPLLLADHLSATGDLATAERLLAEYRAHRSASTL